MAPSLLFIPDISGFTRFVSETEIEHSRHIVAELLDLIIASDRLGLTVSEIEGDAVFFHRAGPLPEFRELVDQARRTFRAFHAHLKSYESRRICDCGACTAAHGLSLKFVAHAGPIEVIAVHDFHKPHGSDVIVAHRLLKNDLPQREYLLVTDAALSGAREPPTPPEWADVCMGSQVVQDVGTVAYRWVPLESLLREIPEPAPAKALPRSRRPLRREIHVDGDPRDVFELVSNLDLRLAWNRGLDGLEYERGRVNRVGTRHRCVIDGQRIDFETVAGDSGPGRRVYGERLLDSPLVDDHVHYFVVEPDGDGTRLTFELHYRPGPFPRSLLAPLLRIRIGRLAPRLLGWIKEAVESGDAHA